MVAFVLAGKHIVATRTHSDKTICFKVTVNACLYCSDIVAEVSAVARNRPYCSLAHAVRASRNITGCAWVSSVSGLARPPSCAGSITVVTFCANPIVSAFTLGCYLSCVAAWFSDCCIHCLHGLPLYVRVDSSEECYQEPTTLGHSNDVLTEETLAYFEARTPVVTGASVDIDCMLRPGQRWRIWPSQWGLRRYCPALRSGSQPGSRPRSGC